MWLATRCAVTLCPATVRRPLPPRALSAEIEDESWPLEMSILPLATVLSCARRRDLALVLGVALDACPQLHPLCKRLWPGVLLLPAPRAQLGLPLGSWLLEFRVRGSCSPVCRAGDGPRALAVPCGACCCQLSSWMGRRGLKMP